MSHNHGAGHPADGSSEPSAPVLRLVFWETTAGCNLECVHCRRLEVSRELMRTDLTTQQGRRLIEQIAEVGRPVLVLSGGEPLMRPDIFDLAEHAKGRGLLIALATNGTRIDEETAQRIAETGFDRVSVSLDGADADTHDRFRGQAGSFDLATRALGHLRGAGVATQINCTIARHNQDQIEAVLDLAGRMGAVAVHYFLLVPVGCGEQIAEEQMLDADEVEERLTLIAELQQRTPLQIKPTCAPHYYRIIRQQANSLSQNRCETGFDRCGTGFDQCGTGFQPVDLQGLGTGSKACPTPGRDAPPGALHSLTKGCLAGTAVCFVSHQGEVFPCGYLPVSAGNVLRQTFGDIWRGSPLLAELRDPGKLTGKCGHCEFKLVCSGCRARAFYQFDDYLAEEPFCAYEPGRGQRIEN